MIYAFGKYVLDVARRELRCRGHLVAIEPKMFEVLHYLLQYRDRVVSKDELFAHCWPDTFVTEAALTRCLTKLRKVMQEGLGSTPVETLAPGPHREVVSPPVPVTQPQAPSLPRGGSVPGMLANAWYA
jgi:DNA-binding winged helix-turn-helix (wHTH) protein